MQTQQFVYYALGVVVVSMSEIFYTLRKKTHDQSFEKVVQSSIITLMTLVWPLAMYSAIDVSSCERRACNTVLAWALLTHATEMHLLFNVKSKEDNRVASIRSMPHGLQMAFSLCGFLGIKHTSSYGPMFLNALLLCITSVAFSHNVHPDEVESHVLDAIQKSLHTWCTNFLMAGIVFLMLHEGSKTGSSSKT